MCQEMCVCVGVRVCVCVQNGLEMSSDGNCRVHRVNRWSHGSGGSSVYLCCTSISGSERNRLRGRVSTVVDKWRRGGSALLEQAAGNEIKPTADESSDINTQALFRSSENFSRTLVQRAKARQRNLMLCDASETTAANQKPASVWGPKVDLKD